MSIDLTTLHGPIEISSPVVVGACPLTASKLQQIALVSSGAGAIVLPSLFEEQVIVWNQRHPKSRVIRIDRPELIQHC